MIYQKHNKRTIIINNQLITDFAYSYQLFVQNVFISMNEESVKKRFLIDKMIGFLEKLFKFPENVEQNKNIVFH